MFAEVSWFDAWFNKSIKNRKMDRGHLPKDLFFFFTTFK